MNAENFLQVFGEILVSETARVKAATYTLRKEYYPHPESLSVLLHLVSSTQESPVRQLAASQARFLVPKHWKSLAEVQRSQFRRQLLQKTLLEKDKRVQHATARVIVAIAKIDIEGGHWMDLPDILLQAAHNSQDPQPRQVSTYILAVSLENLGHNLMFKFRDMLMLFGKTIADSDAEVRINTMLALSRIALILDPENDQMSLEAIQNSIPQMVDVLKQAIGSDDAERISQSFEVFQTLLGCDPQVLNKHIRELVIFMTDLAGAKPLDEDARTQAINFLMQCVRYRKLKIQGLKLGEPITLRCLEIATELGDASTDDEDMTPPRSALSLLDILASTLPPSQVVVPLINALGPFVNSDDPDRRRGGIMSLGMCVDGAPDFVSTQLHEILPLVLRLLEDPELKVRRAALDAAVRLGADAPEDWGKEHEKLVPALVKNMDIAIRSLKGQADIPNLEIIRASCYAIESLVQCMDAESIKPYLHELVPRLSRLFKHPHLSTKASAISATGAIASTAKGSFLPYFQNSMNSLAEFVTIKDGDEEIDLRCTTCDAMGSMALAVGAEAFEPFVQPLMDATGDALHLDHPKLKETSYLFWSCMAKVYGRKFNIFLDTAMKSLFECVEADESGLDADALEGTDLTGKEVTIGGQKIKVATAEELDEMVGLDGVDDDDDDGNDDDDWDDFNTGTAAAQEKEIAVEVIGDIMTHISQDGMQYLESTIAIVLKLTDHFYEGVRRAAIGTLFRVYAAIWQLQGEHVKKWKPGLPVDNNLPAELNKLGDIIMGATLALWEEEDDRACVTDINRSIAATLKLCGPALISDPKTLKPLTEIVLAIITKKHSCQQDSVEFDDMEDLGELSEYDWLLVDTALDVLIALAISLGETFGQLWKTFEKSVVKLASSSEAIERSAAVGVIAECIRGMGNQVTPFTTSLLRLLLHRMNDEDPETKSNAAFATGLLVQNTNNTGEILKAFNTILAKLEPLFEMHKARAVDNAAGCVSRMIMKHQEHVPLGVVLPALLNLLPLKEDVEENEPIYKMIVLLYSSSEPTILSLTPQLLHVLNQVMAPPYDQLNDATREQLIQLLRFVHGKHPALLGEHETLTEVLSG